MVQVEEWEEVITEYRRIFTEIIEWCTETITIIRKKKAPRRYEDAGTGSILSPFLSPLCHSLPLSVNPVKNPKRGTVTEHVFGKIQGVALHYLYTFLCFGFPPDKTLGYGLKKRQIFLFSAAYFLSYWHMPFEINIIT